MTRILLQFVDLLFSALSLAIIARALLSWFRFDPYHPVSVILHDITEPILGPLRRYIPPVGFMDISPLVALILLQIIEVVLKQIIVSTLV